MDPLVDDRAGYFRSTARKRIERRQCQGDWFDMERLIIVSYVTIVTHGMKKNAGIEFASRLQGLLADRRLTAAELGRGVNLSHVAIGNYLKGRLPRVDELVRIARFFRMTMDDLVHGPVNDDLSSISRSTEAKRLDSLAATVERLRSKLNDAGRLLAESQATLHALEEHLALGPDRGRVGTRVATGARSETLAGVSSTVAAVARAGATAALAAATGPVRESSRSRGAGAPSARKRGPGRAAGRDSR
ncbi:helix-turn-helix domain-containing protein [bacterium]|nr:helix-turn-helix domain-containing protein [bacterium]